MDDTLVKQADFENNLATYWLAPGAIALTCSIVGIPLLLIYLPIGLFLTRRYIDNISTRLTRSKLIVKQGIFTRTENTVPIDKITDVALIQGPLMRVMGLHKLTVETAGQSGTGALINLVGINGAAEFRSLILEQKDNLSNQDAQVQETRAPAPHKGATEESEILSLLKEISASLKQIEINTTHNDKRANPSSWKN